MLNNYPDVLTSDEASKALGISTKLLYRLIKNGDIKGKKVGREYRITKSNLVYYLSK